MGPVRREVLLWSVGSGVEQKKQAEPSQSLHKTSGVGFHLSISTVEFFPNSNLLPVGSLHK